MDYVQDQIRVLQLIDGIEIDECKLFKLKQNKECPIFINNKEYVAKFNQRLEDIGKLENHRIVEEIKRIKNPNYYENIICNILEVYFFY